MSDPNPLESMIVEMNRCLAADFPIVAISVAVAIPSICASLEMENGRAQRDEYKKWCADNLYPDKGFDGITVNEIYSLRNGFSHQGKSEILNRNNGTLTQTGRYTRAVFSLENNAQFLNCSHEDFDGTASYLYSAKDFCKNIGDAALHWLSKQTTNETVAVNLSKMATYRSFSGMKAIY